MNKKKLFLTISAFAALSLIFVAPQAKAKKETPQISSTPNKRDSNNDGKISLEEFLAAPTRRFKNKDKNGDGFLSQSEINPPAAKPPAMSAERKAKMQKRRQERQNKQKQAQ